MGGSGEEEHIFSKNPCLRVRPVGVTLKDLAELAATPRYGEPGRK